MPPQDSSSDAAQVRTVCSYCGVGCGMVLDIASGPDGRRTVLKASGDKAHPANFGRLCTKGATTADMLAAPGRLTAALVRAERGAEPAPAGIDEAITETARRLRAIIDEHGPDAVAFYVSGQMSLEAQYLANKLAKGFVRTNQIESNSRLCMASAGSGYKLSLGADGPPGSYQDFEHADVFFVIGSNMADCHPILFLRMMDRVKAGAKLIVVDPRRSATADKADLFLQIKPGTDLALLNGLLHLLHENGHTDADFIAERTEGWEAMPDFLADYPPATVAEITGIPEADIRQAAEWIGDSGRVDELLDHGAQPVHARHLEHQRPGQPAPGHRCDLPPRQRPVLPHRPAQRHGRTRDGLHGARSARAAIGAGGRGPCLRRGAVGPRSPAPCARTDRARAPSRCSSAWPTARSRRAGSSAPTPSRRSPTAEPSSKGWRTPNSSSPRTCSPTPRPTRTPTSCCPARCGPRPRAS